MCVVPQDRSADGVCVTAASSYLCPPSLGPALYAVSPPPCAALLVEELAVLLQVSS